MFIHGKKQYLFCEELSKYFNQTKLIIIVALYNTYCIYEIVTNEHNTLYTTILFI